MRQRIADWLRERRLRRMLKRAQAATTQEERRSRWLELAEEHGRRSPAQVARMERARGLRPRATLKRALVHGYCKRLVPGRAVAALFAMFRLRGL